MFVLIVWWSWICRVCSVVIFHPLDRVMSFQLHNFPYPMVVRIWRYYSTLCVDTLQAPPPLYARIVILIIGMKTATGTPPRLHSTETDCMRPKSEVKDKGKQTNKLALKLSCSVWFKKGSFRMGSYENI